jgi:hypothetical protein
MKDFEKLGLFYLGRRYDLAGGKPVDEPILYDSRDLVTHAVCVGMTGSGKTGLCLSLIEEAAIDGVPVIAIDPKGDLGNLLLTFPRLTSEEFRPWIDEDEARRAGMTSDAYAAAQAQEWRKGLAEWGQDGARIERLRAAADFGIYTPGSRAGIPVSILTSFAAPPADARGDAELMAERASATSTSVLSLAGVDAAPRTREHTLLTSLLTAAWKDGHDADLAGLIQQVQSPPFAKIGIVDVESFFPSKDRFALAMQLNGLLAAPGFEQWLEGEPLDPAAMFHAPDGRPRVSIFSIAHLGDAERMFFVSLLLNQVVAWMRRQTGTSSLRALVYMDEIMGFFPPVANPPSKAPLLTLLKQGRAAGLGIVLTTQNPVDLDYKGLSNTGTWFLGRLQTERDKARVLDGLEGAQAGTLDRAEADRILSALGKRVFLLHNVHEREPVVFQTRWSMSYLRGPLSRDQIRTLMAARRTTAPPAASVKAPPSPAPPSGTTAGGTSAKPVVPPGIDQFFVPSTVRAPSPEPPAPFYSPVVLGAVRVTFSDPKAGLESTRDVLYAAPIVDGPVPVDWAAATRLDATPADLERQPEPGATFAPLPAAAAQPKSYAGWQKALGQWVGRAETLEVWRHRGTKLTSNPGESERDFRVRVQDAMRTARDEAVEAVRQKYAPKQAALAERLRRAQAGVAREQQQASQQKLQTALSMGATVLGALLGRRTVTTGTLGRATTAARGVGRTMKEAEDVKRASDTVEAVRQQVQELEDQVREETQTIAAGFDTAAAPLERMTLTPKRGQVAIQFVALGWRRG